VAHALGDDIRPELMTAARSGSDIAELAGQVESTLSAAFAGEVEDLLRLSLAAGDEIPTFDVIAAVAVEMAGREQDPDRAAELVRLAADLLAADRRARGLNLNPGRQLTSCLLRWQRELDLPERPKASIPTHP
jgi:hypothetical protein